MGQGLWRIRDSAATIDPLIERVSTQTGLSSNAVQSLLEDREGNIWIGTVLGLHSLTPQQLTPLAADALVRTVLPDSDGSVWAGTAKGLVQFRNAGGIWRGRRVGPNADIHSLFRTNDGRVWAFANGGHLVSVEQGQLVDARPRALPAPPCSTGVAVGPVNSPFPTSEVRRAVTLHDAGAERPAAGPRPFCETDGVLWATDHHGGLTVRLRERTVPMRPPSSARDAGSMNAEAIFEDADGTMWIGGSAGLWRIRDHHVQHLGEREGLPATRVMAITQSTDGVLWLAVDRGPLNPGWRAAIVRLEPSAVEHALRSNTRLATYTVFDAANGLAGVPLGAAAAARSTDGSVWFAIGGNLTVVDPRLAAHTRVHGRVPAQIVGAVIDDRPWRIAGGSMLAAGTRKVQIDYTALRLTAPQHVRFRYRLDGFDHDWVDAGARRQAYYTNLAPGDYVFRVQANDESSAWPDREATWSFAVQPAFRQTGWFYALGGLALVAAVWGAVHTRVWFANRQFAATLAERTRLSREIHDTMLQSLVGVALQVQAVARSCGPHASEQQSRLVALRRQVEAYIRDARQAILDLRSPMLERGGLAGALVEIGRRTADPPTRVEVSADEIGHLSPAIEGELLRIGQEAITNAARHAGATRIHVVLQQESGRLRLRVTDNGRGFDVQEMLSSGAGHYGLAGMQERAGRMRGHLTITSSEAGTVVEALVPHAGPGA